MLRTILFTFVMLAVSCSTQPDIAPSPIPREALVEIIAESLIIEPAGRELPKLHQDSIYGHYYNRILDQRGFSMDEFVTSMQILQQNPKELEAVYEDVLSHLQVIEAEAGN